MKKYLLIILLWNSFTFCNGQQLNINTSHFTIINNGKIITNDMIFYGPMDFPKNKKPLYMINGKEVFTIAYYDDHDDFKKITVLQPAEGLIKFGKKGKNGVIMLELKDEVKEPEIEILSNRIYYRCNLDGKIVDTSKEYFRKINGKDCKILDLRDSSKEHIVYINFDNKIKIKHLGFGWDMVSLYVAGGSVSGNRSERIIRIQKEGKLRMIINANGKEKEIMLHAVPLPAAQPQ